MATDDLAPGASDVSLGANAPELDDEPRPLPPRDPVDAPRGRYWIHTWGCQMNVHDSERMAGQLETIGFGQARSEDEADVVLLNTCTVRESAAVKVEGKLGDLKRLKRHREHLVVGVCGCLAQQERDSLFEKAPHLDIVLGPRAIPQLARHVRHVIDTREKVRDTAPWTQTIGEGGEDALRKSFPKAYVTIQEGCDKFCTFCVVPFTRGREKCRSLEVLVAEIRGVARRGFREVELLGQNVNCYADEAGHDMADLLRAVADVDGIERIRFVTSHPKHFSDRIIEAMAHPKVCDALHLPVQSGSSRVLERMGREYTREHYLDRIAALRRVMPDIALQTDVIVGFPGESDEDFEQTLSLLREVGFEQVYSFKYSERPYAKAPKLFEDDVPEDLKASRLKRLQRLQDELQAPRDAARVGEVVEVLVDGMSKRSDAEVQGRTGRNRVVNFPGGPELIGRLIDVEITEAKAHSFRGRPVGERADDGSPAREEAGATAP